MTLEQLLNKLIEKGWKPFGKKYKNVCREPNKWHSYMFDHDVYYRREITAKESWLWQFVCENGMVVEKENEIKMWDDIHSYDYISVEYRLIETSLKNEDELEQFLLDNIKVE